MEDSDKTQAQTVVKKTLKLKPGTTKPAPAASLAAPRSQSAPPAAPSSTYFPKQSPAKSRDPSSWADAHKNRMQADMDALSEAVPEKTGRRSR